MAFNDVKEVRQGIIAFIESGMPGADDELKGRIRDAFANPSPVDQMMDVAEHIYALRDTAPDEAKVLATDVIEFAIPFGFKGSQQGNRGQKMVDALKRRGAIPAIAENDPEPKAFARRQPDPVEEPVEEA